MATKIKREISGKINRRAWELAQQYYELVREQLSVAVATGEVKPEDIGVWAPKERREDAKS